MLLGKHINKYYLRHLHLFVFGVAALILVDYMQLVIPELYRAVVNGIVYGGNNAGGTGRNPSAGGGRHSGGSGWQHPKRHHRRCRLAVFFG